MVMIPETLVEGLLNFKIAVVPMASTLSSTKVNTFRVVLTYSKEYAVFMTLLRVNDRAEADIAVEGEKYIIRERPKDKHLLFVASEHKALRFWSKVPSKTFDSN